MPVALLVALGPLVTGILPAHAEDEAQFLVAVDGDPGPVQNDVVAAGGEVEQVFGELDMLAVTLSADSAAALDALPGIDVRPNFSVHAFGTGTPASYGLDRIDQRSLPLSSSYTRPADGGAGVDVYVMDTGIRADHTEFGGRVAAGYSAIADGLGTNDCNGHGTHVAGTIGGGTVGVAPAVTLVPVRILNCSGATSTGFELMDGLNWVLAQHQSTQPAVLNMSFGGEASSALDDAIAAAVADGITVVVAAGNSNADACGTSPARAPSALTVGASTAVDSRASYSNYGPCLDLFAPGGDGSAPIYSAGIGSSTAIAGMVGTSMAAPHVSGAAALYLATHRTAGPAEVGAALTGNATSGVLSSIGAGSANRLLYVEPLASAPTTAPAAPRWPLYVTRYDGVIYELVQGLEGTSTPVALSYPDWANRYGFAAPRPAPTDFVRYPWSPTIYAVTFWPGGDNSWRWSALTPPEWKAAGFPAPRAAGWIAGSTYYRWSTSPELFVRGADGIVHKLTPSDWAASGYRSFQVLSDQGFVKLSWSPEIAKMSSLGTGAGVPIGYPEWASQGFPTPSSVHRLSGDLFYLLPGSPAVHYSGPTLNRTISYAEWAAAGFPAPVLKSAP